MAQQPRLDRQRQALLALVQVWQQHLEPCSELPTDLLWYAHTAHTSPAVHENQKRHVISLRLHFLRNVLARVPRGSAEMVAAAIRTIFTEDGIEVALDAEPVAVDGASGEQVRLRVATHDGERVIAGTDLLVAAGRMPNTYGIGLGTAGIELDPRGYIKVNERLETTAPGVWAMGECAGSPHFTHVAVDDFRVVHANLAGQDRTTDDRLIPYCVFIDPELARVGLSETDAKRQGIAAQVAKLPMDAVLRAHTIGETRGFMKALIDPSSERILGFAMLGAEAGEVAAVVQTAMLAGLRYTALRDAILTHPTMAEGLNELFAEGFNAEKP
jgi:pyruvate/2-oxoglutarate dehydrogenase complex dihydrolipoamide dehydrogenase (E3) component